MVEMTRFLPTVNACLNATCFILLVSGYGCICLGKKTAHRFFMMSALMVSSLFLISYLVYHAYHGIIHFQGRGWTRPVYFTLLISHTVLAALIVPLALATLYQALRGRFNRHRRMARWTLPIWLYVSFTGVVIYWMLYRWYTF